MGSTVVRSPISSKGKVYELDHVLWSSAVRCYPFGGHARLKLWYGTVRHAAVFVIANGAVYLVDVLDVARWYLRTAIQ
ncbi:hypothetical protein BAUCODRAFT_29415 [Baudoinia panamericana UAMH 10762]|uniref:Uncharacterized protein n=1 Tax=Baudoinia panamericana (strain UAMH 10762) TaxID=717646 RepID=M2NPX5_BAUPA|nr:uncharacterized protein BAUCODRAFT_29415 [Baudoinia panamericana UAMH 10762]EMD01031.1 hypothetical protein BAUCODRAFT_29415 [Baudoinia panamericana UAMH 10762]